MCCSRSSTAYKDGRATLRRWCLLVLPALTALVPWAEAACGDETLPVGYWKFDEQAEAETLPVFRSELLSIDGQTIVVRSVRSGECAALPTLTQAGDDSGRENHAGVHGPVVTAGVRGGALEFDGRADWVEIPDSPSLHISGAVTIQMWVRPDDFSHSAMISKDFEHAGPSWCQMYFWNGDPHLQVAVNHDHGPTVKSRTAFELGRWYHVAASYDGISRTRIHVNGALDHEDTSTFTGPIPVGKESLKLGKRPDGLPFRGAMDEVRIFARELSPEEVLADYQATRPDQDPPRRSRPPEPEEQVPADAGVPVRRHVKLLAEDDHARKLQLTWPDIDRVAAAAAGNLAAAAEGAKPSDVAVALPKAVPVDTIIVRTFGEHVFGRNNKGIRDYRLQCRTRGGHWITVASVKNNTKEHLIHRFQRLVTDEVRVQVTADNRRGGFAQWEKVYTYRTAPPPPPPRSIEVYQLGPAEVFAVRSKSRVVAVEKSPTRRGKAEGGKGKAESQIPNPKSQIPNPKGRIAIFKDDVPMPEGVASSPDYLAEVLRAAGYGVTFLDAELLSNTCLLERANFDLFIHPYGCSFPLGTTLYQFLESGGHLLTLGGQAFAGAVARSPEGKLVSAGYDPGIITTPATMLHLDWYVPLREQLGIFAGPFQVFDRVVSARAVGGQHVIDPAIRIDGPLEGYPSTGLVGQVVPIEEEERYVREGKELPYILQARRGIEKTGKVHSILHADHNYLTFNKPCARWLPLLETYDRYDRPRGSAGSMILNHDGSYRGSTWAFFGVTNRDLFPRGEGTMAGALRDIVDFQMRGVFLHGLRPGYCCYRQGETATARVFVSNFGPVDLAARLTFLFLPLEEDKPIFEQVRRTDLPKGTSTPVAAEWAPERFSLDFYRVRCVLELEGSPVDRMESGFVVWNEEAMQGPGAFRVDFHDNYFHDGRRPVFIVGARTDGLHRIGQHGEDPLWVARQYQMMQDFGMSVVSPVFFQIWLPNFAWGDSPDELVPEAVLRQLDAQVQLCQGHKLIYAPCLFFAHRADALEKIDLGARLAGLLGDRYCRVPGIVFYLWDDGVYFGQERREAFLELTRRCAEELDANTAGRHYLTTAEIMGSHRIGTRRVQKHLTFGHHWHRNCSQRLPARMSDLRAAGQSQACGEFYHWAARSGDDGAHRFYLDYPHNYFGLGYSWILNWKWGDDDSVLFPWGIVHSCDRIPKPPLYTYRNLSWFFRSFRPRYVQPELMFVLPNAYWDKNKITESGNDIREIDDDLLALLDKIMALGHVNLGVVDDFDLPKLAPATKALIYPWAMCPDDQTYRWLHGFVCRGGHLYISGDVSYEPSGKGRRPDRLLELAGVEPVGQGDDPLVPASLHAAGRPTTIEPVRPIGGWSKAYQGRVDLQLRPAGAHVLAVDAEQRPVVVSHSVGKGRVLFSADLSVDVPAGLIEAFLQEAGVDRVHTDPDDPAEISVFRVPTRDGQVFGITSEKARPSVTITSTPSPITLRKTRSPMVMAAVDEQGKLVACETDGLAKVGDRMLVESTASVMIFTLDRNPVETSSAVVLLPQPGVSAKITLQLGQEIDVIEIGDMIGGAWKTHCQAAPESVAGGVRLSLDEDQSLGVVLLTSRASRDEHVRRLTAFLQGYLD